MLERWEEIRGLVSILLPFHNEGKYIKLAIDSVLNQDYKNFELICIDDSSTDNSRLILEEYQKVENRIHFYQNPQQLGIALSLNKGIHFARGEFIARIDGDDIWMDQSKLLKQIEFLNKNKDHVVVGTSCRIIDRSNNVIGFLKQTQKNEEIERKIFFRNPFIHSTVCFRKSALREVGLYDPKVLHAEDYDLWLRMKKIGKFSNLEEYITDYRIHRNSISFINQKRQSLSVIYLQWKYRNRFPKFWLGIFIQILLLFFPTFLFLYLLEFKSGFNNEKNKTRK